MSVDAREKLLAILVLLTLFLGLILGIGLSYHYPQLTGLLFSPAG